MAGTGADATLFEDTFTVDKYDQSKYDRVARITAHSNDQQTTIALDINIELFPCAEGDTLQVVLATSLAGDGSKDDEKGWRDVGEGSLADMYDYVCHGKVYKFDDAGGEGQTIRVYISFGGLLMSLDGPFKKLTPLQVESAYLLVKK